MTLDLLLVSLAVVASVVLLVRFESKLFAIVALVASGLQALAAFDILRIESGVIPLGLVFGSAIAISGVVLWFRATARANVTAATVLGIVGGLQVLESLALI